MKLGLLSDPWRCIRYVLPDVYVRSNCDRLGTVCRIPRDVLSSLGVSRCPRPRSAGAGLNPAEGGARIVFTVEQRDALRDRLLRLAEEDERVVAGAAVGSLAVDGGDRFSDLDLTFGRRSRGTSSFPRRRSRGTCSGGASSTRSTRARASSAGVSGRPSITSAPCATTRSRWPASATGCPRCRRAATTTFPLRPSLASGIPTSARPRLGRSAPPSPPQFSRSCARARRRVYRTRIPSRSASLTFADAEPIIRCTCSCIGLLTQRSRLPGKENGHDAILHLGRSKAGRGVAAPSDDVCLVGNSTRTLHIC